jgi:hypothetical protein
MTHLSKSLAALAFAAVALTTSTASAAQNNGASEPSVADVCMIAWEVCSAGCNAASPDSGLNFNEYISNQLCERQCVDDLNACIATAGEGSTAPARKMSLRKIKSVGFDFKGDGTPNNTVPPPTGDTDQPADPTGGDGGFNPGAVFGGPATTVGPVGNVIY